jgi:phosphoglycerol transferase
VKKLMPYFIALILCLLTATILLKLQQAYWHIPFVYAGDALFYSAIIKGIIDNGWYLHNDFLGMPWGMSLYDFPIPDSFNLLLIKLLSLFTSDYAFILNSFFILTFPLTTITALVVFRHFNISSFSAVLGSLLYTFVPYHLIQSEHHLMYSAYYIIPLMIMVILWVCASAREADGRDQYSLRLSLRSPKFILSLVICVLIASTGGVYYAFFACCLLLTAGLMLALSTRHIRHFLLSGLLVSVIAITLIANLSPSIVYQIKHGKTITAQRSPVEAELYGLKIAQLLLPITGHRLALLSQLKSNYNQNPYLINENDTSSLGFIGSLGFLILLGWLCIRNLNVTYQEGETTGYLLHHLSVLNIVAVLLGTIGGFGALLALLLSPQIRGYNRISNYIAFFALFAVVVLLDRARQRFFHTPGWRAAFPIVVVFLLVLGILDQSSERFVPDYVATQAEYWNDADFIRQIETALPPGSMIFQLPPVKRFPETLPVERVGEYDLFKGYLHSRQLHWTYGAMKERKSDVWQTWIFAQPLKEMVEAIALAGFNGIYVDRFGYPDNAAKLEADLASLLGTAPVVSKNARLSFFNLAVYQHQLQAQYTGQEWETKRAEVLAPLLVEWKEGCYGQEGTPGHEWRWCGPTGQLTLENQATHMRRATIAMALVTASASNLRIESPLFAAQVTPKPEPVPFSKTIEIPPGKHTINFTSDAPKIYAPQDARFFVLQVWNFTLKLAD